MNRKYNISRVLVLVFVLSGLTDLTLDYVAGNAYSQMRSASNERPEFQRFLKSNSLPTENNFSRSKTETEYEEEINHNRTDVISNLTNVLDAGATIVTIGRREIAQ